MPEPPARVVLAFDFGLRRIGIASGDTVSRSAAPYRASAVTASGVDWSSIERALTDFRPHVLIVGTPRHADGSLSSLGPAANEFAAALARRSGLPVRRVDEYASSLEALETLRQQRASGQRRRRVQRADIDSAAAAIILERWLTRDEAGLGDETGGDD
jgi:putative pre-16S rRNA nuclease